MDKIVRHRFWILLALVPPLVVFGYYKANGAIKAATAARTADLDAKLNAIPDGKGPNPTWVQAADGGIEVYNEAIKKAVTEEKVRVWTDQLPRMTWPPVMQPFVPPTYRGQFPREAGFTYKSEYDPDLLEALYQSIEPLKRERDGGVSGKVDLNRKAIPRHFFGRTLIPSDAIWDAQEDLWLLQLLFDSIRNTNRPAENAAKAAVRRLSYIKLMGGDGNSTVRSMGGAAGGGGRGALAGGDEDVIGTAGPLAGRGGMGAMGGMGMMGGKANVTFDPSEEFGAGFEGMAGGGALGGGDEDVIGLATGRGNDMGALAGGINQKEIRYIKFDASAPFRERGFYLSVLIDQKKIADFLVELSNADWPIRIVRFNVGPNPGGTGGTPMGGAFMSGGGRAVDEDDISAMIPARGGGGAGYGNSGGTFGNSSGTFGNEGEFGNSNFSEDLFTAPLLGNGDEDIRGGMGLPGGGTYGPTPMVRGDQLGSLFTHPDLVQLDVCGVITIYNPPAADLLAAVGVDPVEAGAAPADATTAEGAATTGPDAAGAAADPAAEGATTADPAAEAGATDPSLESPALDPIAPAADPAAGAEGATSPEAAPAEAPADDGALPADPAATPAEAAAGDAPAEAAPEN